MLRIIQRNIHWFSDRGVFVLALGLIAQGGAPSGFAADAAPKLAGLEKPPDASQLAFFEKKIRPVLVQKCYKCHAADAEKIKGGLVLDTREGTRASGDTGHAVVPGNLAESRLIEAIRYNNDDLRMPPAKNGGKLPDDVIADFEKWVLMGAPDPRSGAAKVVRKEIDVEKGRQFWAFQPPKKSPAPKVADAHWPKSDIDRFVLASLEAGGLKPVGDADRRTLIRRVYFDLIGLPPSPEAVESFVNDKTPTAFEKIVDKLLGSPQFGERWGRHWLDVARYAESSGKERNILYPEAWHYRDYVIASFNADKPYDQFIREQIAGDLLPAANDRLRAEQIIATGFLAIGPKSLNERNSTQFKLDVIDEQVDVLGQAVLGLTVACARCHDHKFDPIPSRDYYSLAGIFHSTETCFGVERTKGVRQGSSLLSISPGGDQPKSANTSAKPEAAQAARLRAELEKARAERAGLLAKIQQAKKGGSQEDIVKLLKQKGGRGYLQEMNGKIERLEAQLNGSGSSDSAGASLQVMGVKDSRAPGDMTTYIRGEADQPGERVPRGFVQVLASTGTPEIKRDTSGRLELAQWLTRDDNPLTARVMVNRIWHHLFDRGIVLTVDNFGTNGERPANQPLLDHLAVRLIENGWSLKKSIREVVLSRAYQLASDFNAKNYEADPDNTLVWRMSARRLDAESIRDAMLAVSGQINLTPPQGSSLSKARSSYVGRGFSADDLDVNNPHRSVYLTVVRELVPDALGLFDFAEPSLVIGDRDETTVPAQALFMLNSPFVFAQSEQMARRLLAMPGLDDRKRIHTAYLQALSRPPADAERARAEAYLSRGAGEFKASPEKAWTTFCQALFACAEFRYLK